MVHKRTAQLYKEAGIEYPLTTEDYGLLSFERETRNSPNSYRIDQIYRVKHIDKDYIIYNQTIISRDNPGNRKTATETVGTHQEPQFQKRYDPETNMHIPIAVDTSDVIYDIEATKDNIESILNGTYHQKIGEEDKPRTIVPYATNFVLQNGNQKFGDFTRDEFVNRHFDDLLFKATNGYYPRQLKPFGDNNVGINNEIRKEEPPLLSKEKMYEVLEIEQPKKDLLVTKHVEPQERDELNPYTIRGEPFTSEKQKTKIDNNYDDKVDEEGDEPYDVTDKKIEEGKTGFEVKPDKPLVKEQDKHKPLKTKRSRTTKRV